MARQLSGDLQKQAEQVLVCLANGTSEEIQQAQTVMLAKLVQLRAANRVLWQSSRAAKLQTSEAKAGIDTLNLDLQGLYYEQRHLKNEIKSCREAPTIYQEIELIAEEDFKTSHPDMAEQSDRDLMLSRLAHEKEERERLGNIRRELATRKAALIAENKKRKTDLESLEAQLHAFVGAAENIQAIFKKY